jgi:hypothetical protein
MHVLLIVNAAAAAFAAIFSIVASFRPQIVPHIKTIVARSCTPTPAAPSDWPCSPSLSSSTV